MCVCVCIYIGMSVALFALILLAAGFIFNDFQFFFNALLPCCFPAASLLLYCCFTATTAAVYCCLTAAELVSRCYMHTSCSAVAALLQHCCMLCCSSFAALLQRCYRGRDIWLARVLFVRSCPCTIVA